MPTVTVTVAGKSAPEMGKKRGRIKDVSGTLYQALPALLDMVQVGSSYELTYVDDEFKGTKFRVVEGIVPAIGGAPTPAARPSPHQTATSMGEQRYYEAPRDDRGDDIATMAIVKEWIGRIPVGDTAAVVHALRAARRAWKTFKTNPDNIETGRQPLEREYEEFPEQ